MTDDLDLKDVRVRFAPSPTGKLHVGGARTAIYNWAFARSTGGTFVLRIEDTDPERSTAENTRIILRALRWLGLDWDEGPEAGGDAGPYFQTQRGDTYADALERLRGRNAVYPCFCTKETLDAKRAEAEASGSGYTGYDRTCRDIDPDEAAARIAAGEPHVWRLRVPEDHALVEFDDAVYGHMSFPPDVMDDMIVVRTDGSPTYNFAVVCDDANMGITHVIRGDDHLSNTPRQILIYEALGYDVPTFAHLSMVLGTDGRKLSKRHGATSVEEFAEQGILPDALLNFLALLGWSLDGETTIIDRATLCSEFSLERVTKSDAVFDEAKLAWMNGQYIKTMGADAWVEASAPWIAAARAAGEDIAHGSGTRVVEGADAGAADGDGADDSGGTDEGNEPGASSGTSNASDDARLEVLTEDVRTHPEDYRALYPLVAERETSLAEAEEKLAYLYWGANVELDEKSVRKVLLKEGARADEALAACRGVLADEALAWECDVLQEACRALCEPLDFKPRTLFQPLRVAICGNMMSPPLFESIELLTRADVLARIDATVSTVFGG